MVRIEFMKTFIEVVNSGSLKRAAKNLGMSVSSVSFQISSVERFYGAKLLERNANGVTLTDEGRIALKNMEAIVSSVEEAKKLISNIKGEKITIASGMVGINIVHSIQTLLKAKYPEIDVKVELRGAHECIKGVINGIYDFAIVGDILKDHLDSERLHIEEIGNDKLVLIVPKDHPLATKDVVKLEDVLQQPIITLTDDYGITTSLKKALAANGVRYEDLNITYIVNDFFSQINSVSNGMGVAITSYIAACRACEVGLIKIRKIEDFKGDRKVYFVSTKLSMESKRMKEYAEFIVSKGRQLFEDFAKQCEFLD